MYVDSQLLYNYSAKIRLLIANNVLIGEGVTVETWISPAFVDLTCICGFTSLIKATLPIRKLPQSEGESFDSAFLDSTLKKLLNLATKDYNLIP